jgi:PilZ domain
MSSAGDFIAEKRRWPRRRVLKRGKAMLHDKTTVLDCTVRDQSEGGVRLVMEHASSLPAEFRLGIVSDGQAWEVRVVWRRGDQVGVEFLSAPLKVANIRS